MQIVAIFCIRAEFRIWLCYCKAVFCVVVSKYKRLCSVCAWLNILQTGGSGVVFLYLYYCCCWRWWWCYEVFWGGFFCFFCFFYGGCCCCFLFVVFFLFCFCFVLQPKKRFMTNKLLWYPSKRQSILAIPSSTSRTKIKYPLLKSNTKIVLFSSGYQTFRLKLSPWRLWTIRLVYIQCMLTVTTSAS